MAAVPFANFDDKARCEEIYGEYFPGDKPARRPPGLKPP